MEMKTRVMILITRKHSDFVSLEAPENMMSTTEQEQKDSLEMLIEH